MTVYIWIESGTVCSTLCLFKQMFLIFHLQKQAQEGHQPVQQALPNKELLLSLPPIYAPPECGKRKHLLRRLEGHNVQLYPEFQHRIITQRNFIMHRVNTYMKIKNLIPFSQHTSKSRITLAYKVYDAYLHTASFIF